MKKPVLTFILLLMSLSIFAQSKEEHSSAQKSTSTVTTTVTESNTNSWYLGASAGYLFKNNSLHKNPMWYLNNGQFYELNVGTRGKLFGWSAALGYMTLKRDLGQFSKIWLDNQMVFDSITGPGERPANIITDLAKSKAYFSTDSSMNVVSEHAPYKGFYFLTGPNLWFGNGPLKFNLALEGGIGYTQVGYYYVSGFRERPMELPYEVVTQPQSDIKNSYQATIYGAKYEQYGMSQKYHDKMASSSKADPFDEKQDYEIHFMGRLTGNVEYFITPHLSVHGGLNFWYISTPKMLGQLLWSCSVVFLIRPILQNSLQCLITACGEKVLLNSIPKLGKRLTLKITLKQPQYCKRFKKINPKQPYILTI